MPFPKGTVPFGGSAVPLNLTKMLYWQWYTCNRHLVVTITTFKMRGVVMRYYLCPLACKFWWEHWFSTKLKMSGSQRDHTIPVCKHWNSSLQISLQVHVGIGELCSTFALLCLKLCQHNSPMPTCKTTDSLKLVKNPMCSCPQSCSWHHFLPQGSH